jgi:hypothetical protein
MKFRFNGDKVAISTLTPGSTDQYSNGIRLKSDDTAVYTTTTTTGALANDGLLIGPNGEIVTVDATAGLPANTQWTNGLPVASNGALCTSTGTTAYWANGVPFAANGAVTVA